MGKRLVYLCLESLAPGSAAEVHCRAIVSELAKLGWQVEFLAENNPSRLARYARLFWRYAKILASTDVLYVRAHPLAWPAALWARWNGRPVFHEVNGQFRDAAITHRWARPLIWGIGALQIWQYRRAAGLFPVTEELARWLASLASRTPIKTIPNAADTDLFTPGPPRTDECRIIFFGNMAAWHGLDTIVAATQSPIWPEKARLIFIGDGPDGHKAKQAAAQNNPRIQFLGRLPQTDIAAHLRGARASLVTITDPQGRSRTGVFPLKLFESMAAGVAVIATDLPGQAELVRQEACGLVIPMNDAQALARAVRQLTENPALAEDMGARGRAAAVRDHSWTARAKHISATLQAYASSTGTRRSGPASR